MLTGAPKVRRIRRYDVPARHGAVRCWPAPEEMPLAIWQNLETATGADPRLLGIPARHWRQNARRDLLTAALAYSRHAQLVPAGGDQPPHVPELAPEKPIILTGHQPGFFHAGIAVKYALIDWLARHFDGVALNLVVDNDLPRDTQLVLPASEAGSWHLETIDLVPVNPDLPMEYQSLPSESDLDRFAARLASVPLDYLPEGALPRLLEFLRHGAANSENLAALFADLVRRYGRLLGWNWLDLPVSRLAHSECFLAFAGEILRRNEELWTTYNESLAVYRDVNHVRNAARPVPDLAGSPDGPGPREMPLWLFRPDQPRRPLFVRRDDGHLHLGDGRNEFCHFPARTLDEGQLGLQTLEQCLESHALQVRPRAVTMTAFARLFLGDYFIHGIGGARYDAVTDAIIARFFQVRPPAFAVATATLLPPVRDVPDPREAAEQLNYHHWLARDVWYNPQRHLATPDPAALDLARQRRDAIFLSQRLRADRAERDQRREVFDRIRHLNEQLQPWTRPRRDHLAREIRRDRLSLHAARVTHNRNCFFGLFPPADLHALTPNHH